MWIRKHETIVLILLMVVLLRIPTLFEPYWYGDEGIYLTIGQALRSGEELYRDIHDNKPPAIYWVAAIADGKQFWYRMIAGGWNLVTVLVFYKLAKKIWPEKRNVQSLMTGVFMLMTNIPLLEGNVANAELFFLLPTMLAAWLLYDRQAGWKRIFLAGGILGMGSLFKIPAGLEAGVWPLVWLVTGDKNWWRKIFWLGIGMGLVLGGSAVYFASRGTLAEYITAAFGQNIGYLSSWKAGVETGIFTLKGRVIVLAIWTALIFGWARKIGRRGVILGIWGGVGLFAALLSGRPYPHYLLQTVGIMTLLGGGLWIGQRWEKMVSGSLILLVMAAVLIFKFNVYPVGRYYINFEAWALGQIDTQSYYAKFDRSVNNIYKIARLISGGSGEGERIWVWGDSPVIYALARRLPVGKYTAKYHVLDFKAEKQEMEKVTREVPKYIVSYGQENLMPGLSELLEEKYIKVEVVGSASVYRLVEMYN